MSIRDKFVEEFGNEQASKLEAAAYSHGNGINNQNLGSDPFKWVLLICIGYQCFERDNYREYHGITIPFEKIKQWIIENGELASHDGDCDYLALMAGAYNEYVKKAA